MCSGRDSSVVSLGHCWPLPVCQRYLGSGLRGACGHNRSRRMHAPPAQGRSARPSSTAAADAPDPAGPKQQNSSCGLQRQSAGVVGGPGSGARFRQGCAGAVLRRRRRDGMADRRTARGAAP